MLPFQDLGEELHTPCHDLGALQWQQNQHEMQMNQSKQHRRHLHTHQLQRGAGNDQGTALHPPRVTSIMQCLVQSHMFVLR